VYKYKDNMIIHTQLSYLLLSHCTKQSSMQKSEQSYFSIWVWKSVGVSYCIRIVELRRS